MISAEPVREHSNVLDPLLTERTLPQIFSRYSCAICHYFNENNRASFRCVHCAPNTSIYFCQKHVLKVPEHQKSNENFHEPDQIYKNNLDKTFETQMTEKLEKLKLELNCEKDQLGSNRLNMKQSFDFHLDDIIENFLNEIESHRKMLHIEIERVADERKKELEQIENKIVDENKYVSDFIDDIEYDSIEFINSATELQSEAKTYTPEIGPFTSFLPASGGILSDLLSSEYVRVGHMSSVNRYWRDIGSVKYVQLHPSALQRWNLRDMPVITIPHPDYEKHGPLFLDEMFLNGRKAVSENKVERITNVSQLLANKKDRKVNVVLYEGPDSNLHRMAVRHLTDSFEKLTNQATLEIVYEPSDLDLEHVLKPIQAITMRPVNHFYKKNNFGVELNTFFCFLKDKNEMNLVKQIIDNEPKKWLKHGIKNIRAFSRGNILLSYLDDPVSCPMVVGEALLRDKTFYECPEDLLPSEHRPAMTVEVWLDIQHPTGSKNKNYDPFLKQVHFSETSYAVRKLIQNSTNFKIEFIRQLSSESLPWAWIGMVKASGENLESKLDHMVSKRRGYPVKDV